ncbi:ATP-binding protein [Paenibacillus larvae]
MNSIKSRILWYFMITILFVVMTLGGFFILTITQYYYGSVTQILSERSNMAVSYYNKYLSKSNLSKSNLSKSNLSKSTLQDKVHSLLEFISRDDFTKIEFLDTSGKLILDSYGLISSKIIDSPDVKKALKGEAESSIGKNPETGERILSLSNPLKEGDKIVGVIRYSTSVDNIDKTVRNITIVAIFIVVLVVFVSLAVSYLLAKRIVRPLQEVTHAAKEMALGNFDTKAEKHHEDEVGHLADTLNFMADEIQKNDKLKNEFISSISHELRTPLTSIKGWSETLVSGEFQDPEETRLGINIISKETDRLIGLVEDLLDFSKLQSGNLKISMIKLKLNPLVKEIGAQFGASCARKQIRLEVQAEEEPIHIMGDGNRIKQILINSIDNAMKFTPQGGVITVSLKQEGKEALITVQDTGEGIPPEILKHVTEKFFKGTSRQGNGLGLSICKELTELQGGKMTIESVFGEGTTITIRFPLVSPE